MKVLKVYLSLYTLLRSHFVRELMYQEVLSLQSLELSVGRSSTSLEMSYCGALIGRNLYTSSFWHTEQTGMFTERQPFTSGSDFGAFRAQGSICCKASDCSWFPSPKSKNGSSSSS